jgi:hypothetical protein
MDDMNTHSEFWSFGHSKRSPWADDLIQWFDDNGFDLWNPDGVATWRSYRNDHSQRLSIIDLVLLNTAARLYDQFTDVDVSFESSVSSDHASLSIYWYPQLAFALTPLPILSGYVVDNLGRDSWAKHFSLSVPPDITDIPSLNYAAECLHHDIDAASASVFPPRKAPHPHGARWWSKECDAALTCVCLSHGWDRTRAIRELRNIIGNAK